MFLTDFHTQKYTGGIISQVGIFLTVTLATSGENARNKRAIPALAIIQGVAAIGGMMIKGINALVDAKRASSFNNVIKLVNENVQITHD